RDLVSDCFRKVVRLYKRDLKRKPSLRELVGTVQAVLEAQLQDHTSDGESAELAALTFKTRKIPKRQRFCQGRHLEGLGSQRRTGVRSHLRSRSRAAVEGIRFRPIRWCVRFVGYGSKRPRRHQSAPTDCQSLSHSSRDPRKARGIGH